ncbi:DMT family transporter [Thermomicrobiaceae bacterium CFH 74404]|uniref:DMT family transporter n=1 Tax=Thermalbibacter longus TaxID=2951981 RepID=A0AA41WJE3_9BACT|nr:EamA family transporter [Thermalbibacter longus]MCM8750486.1 DMT family transporter [Thermalbibacter longus]
MVGVGLALVSSLLWGAADFLAGLANRRAPLVTVLLGTQLAGLALVALVLLASRDALPRDARLGYAALGAVGAAVGLGALYRGLALGPMGVVAPISALSGAVPLLAGLALGERPSGLQLVGMALSLLGVAAAAAAPSTPAGGQPGWVAAGLGLVAAAGIGSALVGLNAASTAHPVWAVLALRLAVVTALFGGLLARRVFGHALGGESPLGESRPATVKPAAGDTTVRSDSRRLTSLLIVTAGTLDAGSNLLFGVASGLGALSVVGVLGSLYPVSTVLLARFVLGERLRPVQLAGVGAVLAGVSAISLG